MFHACRNIIVDHASVVQVRNGSVVNAEAIGISFTCSYHIEHNSVNKEKIGVALFDVYMPQFEGEAYEAHTLVAIK